MGMLLERYRAGEYVQVWTELLAYGDQIRNEPLWSEATAVAYETMHRVRVNVERLVAGLNTLGYQFTFPTVSDALVNVVFMPPAPNTSTRILELEQIVGPLPLALRAWYDVVGTVNFMGTHPHWPRGAGIYPDPLVVGPLEYVFVEYDDWHYDRETYGANKVEPFRVSIAPDDLHKSDVSGGAPYAITLPNASADALLENEWHHTTFVEYLRICFRWGGFPGFERYTKRPTNDLTKLVQDLMPI